MLKLSGLDCDDCRSEEDIEENNEGLEQMARLQESSVRLLEQLAKNLEAIDQLSQNHGGNQCYTYIRKHDICNKVDGLYSIFEDMPSDDHMIR